MLDRLAEIVLIARPVQGASAVAQEQRHGGDSARLDGVRAVQGIGERFEALALDGDPLAGEGHCRARTP